MVAKAVLIFTYVLSFLFFVCILATVTCIYLIYKTRRKSLVFNQRDILANLIVVEFFFALIQLKINVSQLLGSRPSPLHVDIELYIRLVFGLSYILTMHHVALDRLLEVYLHLAYITVITKRRTIMIIVGIWIFSVLFATCCTILMKTTYSRKEILVFAFYFFFAGDITFLIHAFITYGYLYKKFRGFRKCSRQHSNAFAKKSKSPKFLIPCMIILSYLAFGTTGSLLSATIHFVEPTQALLYRKIALTLYCFGILSDNCIYILLQRKLRTFLSKRLYSLKSRMTGRVPVNFELSTIYTNFTIPSIQIECTDISQNEAAITEALSDSSRESMAYTIPSGPTLKGNASPVIICISPPLPDDSKQHLNDPDLLCNLPINIHEQRMQMDGSTEDTKQDVSKNVLTLSKNTLTSSRNTLDIENRWSELCISVSPEEIDIHTKIKLQETASMLVNQVIHNAAASVEADLEKAPVCPF